LNKQLGTSQSLTVDYTTPSRKVLNGKMSSMYCSALQLKYGTVNISQRFTCSYHCNVLFKSAYIYVQVRH